MRAWLDGDSYVVDRGVFEVSCHADEALAIEDAVRVAWAVARTLRSQLRGFLSGEKTPEQVINFVYAQRGMMNYNKKDAMAVPLELIRAAATKNPARNPGGAGAPADIKEALKGDDATTVSLELVNPISAGHTRVVKNPTPGRRVHERSDDEVQDEFERLVKDPDPASMDFAQDFLIDHGKTLVEVSERTMGLGLVERNGIFLLSGDVDRPEWGVKWWVREEPGWLSNGPIYYSSVRAWLDGDGYVVDRGVVTWHTDEALAIEDAVRVAWAVARTLRSQLRGFLSGEKTPEQVINFNVHAQRGVMNYNKKDAMAVPLELIRAAATKNPARNPGGAGAPAHRGRARPPRVGSGTAHSIEATLNGGTEVYTLGNEPVMDAVQVILDGHAIGSGVNSDVYYRVDDNGDPIATYVLYGFTQAEVDEVRNIHTELTGDDPVEQGDEPVQNPGKRRLVQNPPSWVTKHLADAWVTLEQQVPAQWMPKLDRTISKGKKLIAEIPEYGCGAYGCVFPTLDPKMVLKVSTDESEATFAARIASTLKPGVVTRYDLALELPTAKRHGRNVYLLWREAADHVGEVDKVLGHKAEAAIAKQHDAAQVALQEAWAVQQGTGDVNELAEGLATWMASVQQMGQVAALKSLADGMNESFINKRVFFGDVHGGNLGLANGKWVITDPGNIVVMDEATAKKAVAMFSRWKAKS